jgi:hypothetical protein
VLSLWSASFPLFVLSSTWLYFTELKFQKCTTSQAVLKKMMDKAREDQK